MAQLLMHTSLIWTDRHPITHAYPVSTRNRNGHEILWITPDKSIHCAFFSAFAKEEQLFHFFLHPSVLAQFPLYFLPCT